MNPGQQTADDQRWKQAGKPDAETQNGHEFNVSGTHGFEAPEGEE
jgi:hypothetical protein